MTLKQNANYLTFFKYIYISIFKAFKLNLRKLMHHMKENDAKNNSFYFDFWLIGTEQTKEGSNAKEGAGVY